MIPDIELGEGVLDALRRRMLRRQGGGYPSAIARRLRPQTREVRLPEIPIDTLPRLPIVTDWGLPHV